MKTRVIVAGQKKYWTPEETIYMPLFVGAALINQSNPDWEHDDHGINISDKNRTYCELTALYWAWKNLDTDILGLCHYRRYLGSAISFLSSLFRDKKKRILTGDQIVFLLKNNDIILPKKRHYRIETRESQYAHAHHIEDLRVTETVIQERYPSYLPAWKHMLASRSGHICNMFIMQKDLSDEYCTWLFDVLFEVEKRLDISSYSDNDKRVFGFLGERLLDVWIETKGLLYVEVPMINLESQHWLKKGTAFLNRKFGRTKKN